MGGPMARDIANECGIKKGSVCAVFERRVRFVGGDRATHCQWQRCHSYEQWHGTRKWNGKQCPKSIMRGWLEKCGARRAPLKRQTNGPTHSFLSAEPIATPFSYPTRR